MRLSSLLLGTHGSVSISLTRPFPIVSSLYPVPPPGADGDRPGDPSLTLHRMEAPATGKRGSSGPGLTLGSLRTRPVDVASQALVRLRLGTSREEGDSA